MDADTAYSAIEWCCDAEASHVIAQNDDHSFFVFHVKVNREQQRDLGFDTITADDIKNGMTWYHGCNHQHDCCGCTFRSVCLGVVKLDADNFIAVVARYFNV